MTLVVTAHARALPAHKLVPFLVGPINAALRDRGLPPGLVEVQRGESEPWVVIAGAGAISSKVEGVTVTDSRAAGRRDPRRGDGGSGARPLTGTDRQAIRPRGPVVPRTVQLRRYNVKPHLLEEFLAWWQSTPGARSGAAFGFTVESAYLNRETAEFTWAVSAEGDADEFRRLEKVWMDSPERTVVFEGIDGWNDATDIALVEQIV